MRHEASNEPPRLLVRPREVSTKLSPPNKASVAEPQRPPNEVSAAEPLRLRNEASVAEPLRPPSKPQGLPSDA
jgi:hypothetical protein